LQNHRDLIDAELAINEGGGGALRNGSPFRLAVQLAEKVYQTYQLEVTDRGGHSAAPRRDNPIYRLAEALQRLARFEFPPRLNPVTRAFFERMAAAETGPTAEAIKALLAGSTDAATLAPLASRSDYNAQMRTTCVATMLEAGHAENALPQTARATVNCRILPTESVEEVSRTLARVIADEKVAIIPKGTAVQSSPSAANPEVMQAIAKLSVEMWPGVALNAAMSAGYTDNRWLRNAGIPAYGISGLFSDPGNNGVHGRNEQIGAKALFDSKQFLYRLVKSLAGTPASERK
jgi:acetylornithine deacetylase/succinyl-diaminopimelate desuccinylase-like protein